MKRSHLYGTLQREVKPFEILVLQKGGKVIMDHINELLIQILKFAAKFIAVLSGSN